MKLDSVVQQCILVHPGGRRPPSEGHLMPISRQFIGYKNLSTGSHVRVGRCSKVSLLPAENYQIAPPTRQKSIASSAPTMKIHASSCECYGCPSATRTSLSANFQDGTLALIIRRVSIL